MWNELVKLHQSNFLKDMFIYFKCSQGEHYKLPIFIFISLFSHLSFEFKPKKQSISSYNNFILLIKQKYTQHDINFV